MLNAPKPGISHSMELFGIGETTLDRLLASAIDLYASFLTPMLYYLLFVFFPHMALHTSNFLLIGRTFLQ